MIIGPRNQGKLTVLDCVKQFQLKRLSVRVDGRFEKPGSFDLALRGYLFLEINNFMQLVTYASLSFPLDDFRSYGIFFMSLRRFEASAFNSFSLDVFNKKIPKWEVLFYPSKQSSTKATHPGTLNK